MEKIVRNVKKIGLSVLTLSFMLCVYLPVESFLGNHADFPFTLQMFLPHNLYLMIVVVVLVSLALCLLKEDFLEAVVGLLLGLTLAVYFQYMFLNRSLALLDGQKMNWEALRGQSIGGCFIWAVCLSLPVVLAVKKWKYFEKLSQAVFGILLGIQLITLVTLCVMAPKSVYRLQPDYMSAEEQFVVSQNKNVIVFVLDAVDNQYVKTLLAQDPSAFDGFKDFTLYTNTCSVYDATKTSMTQMLTGMEPALEMTGEEWFEAAWASERAETFYERFHSADYRINGYNLESGWTGNFEGKFDNYGSFGKNDIKNLRVDKDVIYSGLRYLTLYRALPMVLKRFVPIDALHFADAVRMKEYSFYENDEFEANLKLCLSESNQNYLIIQHLDGVHEPCKDTVAETKYLLQIMQEYLRQLKELGVYDNAAILITSDHGRHNAHDFGAAGTPIMMMKESAHTGEKMQMSSAPVYHEDFQATLLDCAGLYREDEDQEVFGSPIFSIPQDAKRARTWYDRRKEPDYPQIPIMGMPGVMSGMNSYHAYTFEGSTEDLERMVEEDDYTECYLLKDYRG